MNSTRRQILHALASAPFAASSVARAQAFPSHAVTLYVPWPAGNPTDALARKLQPAISKSLGQVVIIENTPGAGGTLGAGKVLAAPADGHTVLVSTPTELIFSPLSMANVRYQPTDFRMIGLFGRVPYMLVSRPDLPQKTMDEILALKGRKDVKPLSYGSIGAGSLIHIISAQFGRATGVELLHVPYKGVPPILQDVVGGQIDFAFLPVAGPVIDMVETGRLRALGITAAQPFNLFPKYPTLASTSPVLEGFSFDVWGGFHVPKSVPREVAERWNRVFYEVTDDPEFRTWARSTGTDMLPRANLDQLESFYEQTIRQYQGLAKTLGVTPV